MERGKNPTEEKEAVETQTPASEEHPEEVKKDVPKQTSSSSALIFFVIGLVFLVLLAGAIVLGQRAEKKYGNELIKKLPQTIVTKWFMDKTLEPTPMIALEFKPSPTSIPETTGSALLKKPSPTEDVAPTPPSDAVESEFILPFSNMRKVVTEDLTGLVPWELKVARNEIYARHGSPFVSKDLSCYFAKQSWYTIDPAYTDKSLSSLEMANAVFILDFEKEIESSVVSTDGGCESF